MAAETTSTSVTEIVNSEAIARTLLAYAIDVPVIAPLCRMKDIAGLSTATASYPQWEKDAVSDITTEGTTTLSNVELQTTEVAAIAAAQVGILREVTDFALATNQLGPDGLMQFIVEDGAKLCIDELENDLAALFNGFSTSIGTSGSDMTVANFVEAVATMRTKNARGQYVCVLDDVQASDLMKAVAASTGTVFAGNANLQSILNARSDGFVGTLFDVPIWVTNLTDTANTGADVVGAMFVNGSTNPEYAGFGIAMLWMPKVKQVAVPSAAAEEVAITMAYGVGRISDFGCDITTDA